MYSLYQKYTIDTPKLTHMKFNGGAVQALIYFDPDEWPATGPFIPHVRDIRPEGVGTSEEDDDPQVQEQQQQR